MHAISHIQLRLGLLSSFCSPAWHTTFPREDPLPTQFSERNFKIESLITLDGSFSSKEFVHVSSVLQTIAILSLLDFMPQSVYVVNRLEKAEERTASFFAASVFFVLTIENVSHLEFSQTYNFKIRLTALQWCCCCCIHGGSKVLTYFPLSLT